MKKIIFYLWLLIMSGYLYSEELNNPYVDPATLTSLQTQVNNLPTPQGDYLSSSSIECIYQSTDTTGDLCTSTTTVLVDSDYTIYGWRVKSIGQVTGNCKVHVSSAGFNQPSGLIDGTDIPRLTSQASSSSTALTGWATSLGKGGSITFVLQDAADTIRGFVIDVLVKKWAW